MLEKTKKQWDARKSTVDYKLGALLSEQAWWKS
jgi:hypothetical protein